MELLVITSREQLGQYREDWSFILEKRQNTNPFIEFDWVDLWWKYLGENHAVEVMVVLENGQAIGFFPFLYKKKRGIYTYQFVGFGQANYMDMITEETQIDATIEFVLDEIIKKRKHVVFYLHGLLESGDTPASLERYLQKRNSFFSIHRVVTPYISLKEIKFGNYMEKRKRLHRLDRREKRLRDNGKVEIHSSGPEDMDLIFQLHEKRWKKRLDTSGFTNEKERAFYRGLAQIQEGPLKTQIDSMYVNNTMIAFNYGFSCRGKVLGYVLGYDDNFETFGPGRILEKEKILQCKNENIQIFDLSIGYEKYKFDWNTDVDYTRRMIFSSTTASAKLQRSYLSMKESLIEYAKKNHKLTLFKRITVGKYVYIMKNLFHKDGNDVRTDFMNYLKKIPKYFYERNRYVVYKINKKDVPELPISKELIELTLSDAMHNEQIAQKHMKEICRKMYGGYKGYYPSGNLTFDNIIWMNDRVLRIDQIAYLEQFRKSSIFFKNWHVENLPEVFSSIKKNSDARLVYVAVKDRSKKEKRVLEEIGFLPIKKVNKRTTLGFGKYHITE